MKNKKKGYKHITKAERLEMAILLKKGYSCREIARVLNRSHSSIIRDIKKRKTKGVYDPERANFKAVNKRSNSKYQGMKIRENPVLERYVRDRLESGWSPEYIAGRVKEVDAHLPEISHRVIYKYVYSNYGNSLCPFLRTRRYRSKKRKPYTKISSLIPNRKSIEKRPQSADKRLWYGHYEIDRVESGRDNRSGLLVIYDRKSKYCNAVLTQSKKALENEKAIIQAFRGIRKKRTLTYDNDTAFMYHEEVNRRLSVKSYFCHPYSSWEKGGVEHINKLLREYIPKGCDVDQFNQNDIDEFVNRLNTRPRKCLNYRTPLEVMMKNNCFNTNYLNKLKRTLGGALQGEM